MFSPVTALLKISCLLAIVCFGLSVILSCGKKSVPTAGPEQAQQPAPSAEPVSSPDEPPAPSKSMVLPTSFGRHTGDLDEMAKRRNIRALVILNPISFFYDKGQPRGVMYEALEEFQKFANQKLNTGKLQVKVTFLPMRVDQIEAALTEGLGDMIAYGIVVTPDREKRVAFSTPIQTDVTQIIVTGPDFGPVSTLADLGGKEVYVNPLTTYYHKPAEGERAASKSRQDADRNQGG